MASRTIPLCIANLNTLSESELQIAVSYTRVSKDDSGALNSINRQDETVDEEAEAAKHFNIVEKFSDGVEKGWKSLEEREALNAAIERAKQLRCPIVIWKLDRLSRLEPWELSYLIGVLERAGGSIYEVSGRKYWTTKDIGQLISLIVEGHATHKYVRDLSDNVSAEMKRLAKLGCWLGDAPLGFETYGPLYGDNGYKLRPREKDNGIEVQLVRRIFDLYTHKRYSTTRIAKLFNDEEIPTTQVRRGYRARKGLENVAREKRPRVVRKWSDTVVGTILKNPVYIGMVVWGTRTPSRLKSEPNEIIAVQGDHGIIDEETFRIAQSKLAKNNKCKNRQRHKDSRAVLTSLLRCSCGSKLSKASAHSSKEVLYECLTIKRHTGKCDGCRVHQSKLLPFVVNAISDHFTGERAMEVLKNRIYESLKPRQSTTSQSQIRKTLNTRKTELKQTVRQMAILPDLADEFKEVALELKYEISRLENKLAEPTLSPEQCRSEAESLAQESIAAFADLSRAYSESNYDDLRGLLLELVHEIQVFVKREKGSSYELWENAPRDADFEINDIDHRDLDPKNRTHRNELCRLLLELCEEGAMRVTRPKHGSKPQRYEVIKGITPKNFSKNFVLVGGAITLNRVTHSGMQGRG